MTERIEKDEHSAELPTTASKRHWLSLFRPIGTFVLVVGMGYLTAYWSFAGLSWNVPPSYTIMNADPVKDGFQFFMRLPAQLRISQSVTLRAKWTDLTHEGTREFERMRRRVPIDREGVTGRIRTLNLRVTPEAHVATLAHPESIYAGRDLEWRWVVAPDKLGRQSIEIEFDRAVVPLLLKPDDTNRHARDHLAGELTTTSHTISYRVQVVNDMGLSSEQTYLIGIAGALLTVLIGVFGVPLFNLLSQRTKRAQPNAGPGT